MALAHGRDEPVSEQRLGQEVGQGMVRHDASFEADPTILSELGSIVRLLDEFEDHIRRGLSPLCIQLQSEILHKPIGRAQDIGALQMLKVDLVLGGLQLPRVAHDRADTLSALIS